MAIEAVERGLELLGHKVPQWSVGFLIQLLRQAFVQVLHTMLPALFVGRKELVDTDRQLLITRLHHRLTYACFFERGKISCLWTHLRSMNLAERYPPTEELARVYSIHAPVMGLVAYYSRGIAYAQKALDICKAEGDVWGQGLALSFHGLILYAASRFDEGIEKCSEAVRVLERAGDLWEVNVARVHHALCLFRLGDLAASSELAEKVHFSGAELGDDGASGFSLDVWAWSTEGQIPTELLQTELGRDREDVQVTAQVMMAEGVRLFMLDRVNEASDMFKKGHQLAQKAGLQNAYVLPLRSWAASAFRHQAEKTSHWAPKSRTKLLKRARKVTQSAVRVGRWFRNDLPHALREAGLIAAMQGSIHTARQHLNESLAVAERQGARFEHAQTLLALGRIGLVVDWPGAAEDLTTARQACVRSARTSLSTRHTCRSPNLPRPPRSHWSIASIPSSILVAGSLPHSRERRSSRKSVRQRTDFCAGNAACCSNSRTTMPGKTSPRSPGRSKWNTAAKWPIAHSPRARSSSSPKARPKRKGPCSPASVRRCVCPCSCAANRLVASTWTTATSAACSARTRNAWPSSSPPLPVQRAKTSKGSPSLST